MSMPFFVPGDDPGANFPELLRRVGIHPAALANSTLNSSNNPIRNGSVFTSSAFTTSALNNSAGLSSVDLSIPHATTCIALRYEEGVVMAGDRRATSGNLISHRSMEKVVQADKFSGVAIAGAAGPAMEMIRLFQLQLEHYEKVEGSFLSLEGKANQLSMMVRGNLPAAMQGMVVVPILAGYDHRRATGRLWAYDVTGGRYEEHEYVATGSGSLHAGTVIKIGHRPNLGRDEALNLACRALWEAADADSATGGPDALRGIYPVIATITVDGWQRVGDDDLAERYVTIAAEMGDRT